MTHLDLLDLGVSREGQPGWGRPRLESCGGAPETEPEHLPIPLPPKQISLDDEELAQHPATTEDIRVCCQDIKVLGRKELRFVLGMGGSSGSPEGSGEAWEGHDNRHTSAWIVPVRRASLLASCPSRLLATRNQTRANIFSVLPVHQALF